MGVGLEDIKKLRTMTGAGLVTARRHSLKQTVTLKKPLKSSVRKDRLLPLSVLTAKLLKVLYS